MGYEDAISTKMLATHCACCSKILRDAKSVETGVGPECRKKHGYGTAEGPADWPAVLKILDGVVPIRDIDGWNADAQKAANVLTHRVAVEQDGENVTAYTNAIRALGYSTLANRIAHRLASLDLMVEGDLFILKAPMPDDRGLAALRAVPGRWWDKANRRTTFPKTARAALFGALKVAYPGQTVNGPRGIFTIEAA